MRIRIKSSLNKPSNEAIKILRRQTAYSMEEIKNRFANRDVIYEFDTLEEEKEHSVFEVIRELESVGIPLKYYECFKEEEISEQLVKNLFQQSRDISKQIDRENNSKFKA